MQVTSERLVSLLDNVTTTVTGHPERSRPIKKTFQAFGITTAGGGSVDVVVEVSNDQNRWETAGVITLTLATSETSDGFQMDASWLWMRGRVSAISGTGAKVSLITGL